VSRKFQVLFKIQQRVRRTLHEDVHTFMMISRPILLIMRNVSD